MSGDAARPCIRDLAVPALRAARDELRRTTRYSVELDEDDDRGELLVTDPEGDTFRYRLSVCDGAADGAPAGSELCVGGTPDEMRLTRADCSIESLRDHCLETCRHWLLC